MHGAEGEQERSAVVRERRRTSCRCGEPAGARAVSKGKLRELRKSSDKEREGRVGRGAAPRWASGASPRAGAPCERSRPTAGGRCDGLAWSSSFVSVSSQRPSAAETKPHSSSRRSEPARTHLEPDPQPRCFPQEARPRRSPKADPPSSPRPVSCASGSPAVLARCSLEADLCPLSRPSPAPSVALATPVAAGVVPLCPPRRARSPRRPLVLPTPSPSLVSHTASALGQLDLPGARTSLRPDRPTERPPSSAGTSPARELLVLRRRQQPTLLVQPARLALSSSSRPGTRTPTFLYTSRPTL